MPTPRPFFNKKTKELKELYEAARGDRSRLLEILNELNNRSTSIAIALRDRIEKELQTQVVVESPQATPVISAPISKVLHPSNRQTTQSQPVVHEVQSESLSANQPASTSFPLPLAASYPVSHNGKNRIQPVGVSGRPSAWTPRLKDDVSLAVNPDDSLSKVFRAALVALIRELREKYNGTQQFMLESGKRLAADLRGYSYIFAFTDEANLFESAKVDVLIGRETVAGQITGLLQGQIIITLEDDFGPVIMNCILRIDNTALLHALHDRLVQIDDGEPPSFRADLATSVLQNKGAPLPPTTAPAWPWTPEPNHQQQEFVRMALANEVTWLWGPPGTGKTDVLALFTRLQYDAGKRILICSNTNQAVDQLLLKLCQKISQAKETTLEEGRVLRLGRIEHDELRQSFEGLITIDGIVARRSKDLTERKQGIENELVRISEGAAHARRILEQFEALDTARKELANSENELQRKAVAKRDAKEAAQEATATEERLQLELNSLRSAGMFRRFFMRGEEVIQQDLQMVSAAIVEVQQQLESIAVDITKNQKIVETLRDVSIQMGSQLASEDRGRCHTSLKDFDTRSALLRAELSRIAEQLDEIKASVLAESRIVGATATRTFLRPSEFSNFDTVIIDEASMILLPAVYHIAGLAKERIVVAGDFRQLPPIVQTEQEAIFNELGHDVFTRAGITTAFDEGTMPPRLVMLQQQYRMDDKICRVISSPFYKGELVTAADRKVSLSPQLPPPFSGHLTLIDTSSLSPFTTRNAFKSHLNLMHALVIRNLLFYLQKHGCFQSTTGANSIGLCSPYAAQIRLLHAMADGHGWSNLMRISTAHRFQGDERETIIVDLVDSIGESKAGLFLQANHLNASGARLFNVAFSRAKENLIVVGNLEFLEQKLPGDSILRGLLHDLQNSGKTVDALDVLAMYPIADDLERFGTRPQLDPETSRTGLFGENDFWKTCRIDLAAAKRSIVIFSGFITPARTAEIGDSLRARIDAGVKVRCVTRPPGYNGSIPADQGHIALKALEAIGVAIDLRQDIHEKVVVIDGRIVWFGSLNPLSHSSKTSEIMGRIDNAAFACQIAQLLSLRPSSVCDESGESFAELENPRCPECGSWTVLKRGKYGRYLQCEADKHWSKSLDLRRS